VLALQLRAAEALMPYHHAKQPQQLDLPMSGEGFKRPLMQIGELHGNVIVGENGQVGLSIFDQPREIVENQPLSEGESVRLEVASRTIAQRLAGQGFRRQEQLIENQ
jgi:hypothetical protein